MNILIFISIAFVSLSYSHVKSYICSVTCHIMIWLMPWEQLALPVFPPSTPSQGVTLLQGSSLKARRKHENYGNNFQR